MKWRHAAGIVKPVVRWSRLRKHVRARRTRWSLTAAAGEEATFRAAVFKAAKKRVLAKRLARGRAKAQLFAKGKVKAKSRVVYFPARRLKPGTYVFAIRMAATMNPKRVSVFVSRPFRVGPKRR